MDLALCHKGDAMRDIANEAHFMGDDEHDAVGREQADSVQNLTDAFGIEGGGYLV